MADAAQIRTALSTALLCVEKVTSFASSIDPLFGIVSSLVGVARKGLVTEERHPLDNDFQEIRAKLETISHKNRQCLRQIRIDEVNAAFGPYEQFIRHQYEAFNDMVERVRRDPAGPERHMTSFKDTYERDEGVTSLKVYYRGVMGKKTLFGRSLLQVYLENCGRDRAVMEHHCSHIAHLFHMGLIALMAYTAVIQDDEDEVRDTWTKRVMEIQGKMLEVLSLCEGPPGSPEQGQRGQV